MYGIYIKNPDLHSIRHGNCKLTCKEQAKWCKFYIDIIYIDNISKITKKCFNKNVIDKTMKNLTEIAGGLICLIFIHEI